MLGGGESYGQSRINEGTSELRDRDIRMNMIALIILLIVIFLSVLVDRMFLGESGLLRNVLCKIYAIFCSALSIFIAFSLSKQNWMLHECPLHICCREMDSSIRKQQSGRCALWVFRTSAL